MNLAVKIISIVAGMLAGADLINDLDLLRHGALPRIFHDVPRPLNSSTDCVQPFRSQTL